MLVGFRARQEQDVPAIPRGTRGAPASMGRAWGGCSGAGEATHSMGLCSGSDPVQMIKPREGAQDTWEGRTAALDIGVELIFRTMLPARREGVRCLRGLRLLEGKRVGRKTGSSSPSPGHGL